MVHISSTPFRKSVNCPSSRQLLNFLKRRSREQQASAIKVHLSICDFCSAEVEFYDRFPSPPAEDVTPAPMPAHLYELASALLGNHSWKSADFDSLLDPATDDKGLS